jgi:hypothetical protein
MTELSRIANRLRTISLVHVALATGMLIFGLIALYIHNLQTVDNEMAKMFRYVLIGSLTAGLMGSYLVSEILIRKIDKNLDLETKISKYLPVVLIRCAFLEVPGLLAGVAILLTGRSYFIVTMGLLLLAFYFYRPSLIRISNDLSLTIEERERLDEIAASLK